MQHTATLREVPTNYYTRKKGLKHEFLAGLRERRIDEKFKYVGKRQATAWFNVCNSPEYGYYRNSKKLLQNTIQNFVGDYTTDVNVVSLGPGNAFKEKIIVQSFLENHAVALFFVDISKEVTNVAVANVLDTHTLQELFIADLRNFEDIADLSDYVRDQYHPTNFFTLLGNTLGNYPQPVILKTLRNAMTPGDKILIDVHIKSGEEGVLQTHKMLQNYSNSIYREQIMSSLSEAAIGEADGTIEVELSEDELFPQMQVVKQFFRFTRSKVVTYLGEDIYFAKGERILVGYSNKYTFECLENLFTSHGLRIVKQAKDDAYYQLLCELA